MTRWLRLVELLPEHAAALRLRPGAANALALLGPPEALAARYAAAGPAWTLLDGDRPLALGGAVRFWPGTGELWCWAGEDIERFGVGFARLARKAVELMLHGGGMRRVQAHVLESDQRARGFVQFLGLSLEGRCPGYGPDGSTCLLYGRYVGWKA